MGFEITPDYFVFKVENVKIKYMTELILQSYKCLPHTFFGDKEFKNVEIDNNTIRINLDEWLPFHGKLYAMMCGNAELVQCFIDRMRNNLSKFENLVDLLRKDYDENNYVDRQKLKDCFECYSMSQGYAFLNLALPVNKIKQLFEEESDNTFCIDDFIISLIEPHRSQRRRCELELALKMASNSLCQQDIYDYKCNEFLYTKESEWHFYTPSLEFDNVVVNAIKEINSKLTVEDINLELSRTSCSRNKQLKKIYKILSEEYNNKLSNSYNGHYYLIVFLINAATEEEFRHIINTKFMHFLGKLAYDLDVDISRTSTEKLISYLSINLNLRSS